MDPDTDREPGNFEYSEREGKQSHDGPYLGRIERWGKQSYDDDDLRRIDKEWDENGETELEIRYAEWLESPEGIHAATIDAEVARNITKKNWRSFIGNAQVRDIKEKQILAKHREGQETNAWLHRMDEKYRAITARRASSNRNDKEGEQKELVRRTDQYRGLDGDGLDAYRDGVCSTPGYDDHIFDEQDDYEDTEWRARSKFYNPLEWIPDTTAYRHGTEKEFKRAMGKIVDREQRRKKLPR
jgi:hypothetical protein